MKKFNNIHKKDNPVETKVEETMIVENIPLINHNMEKFDKIHNKVVDIDESNVLLVDYIVALGDLKSAITEKSNKMYDALTNSDGILAKTYYTNAIEMGRESKFFSKALNIKINKANKQFTKESEEKLVIETVSENIDFIIKELNELKENSAIADLGSVDGMGSVELPNLDGKLGSGDVPGASAVHIELQKPAEKITMSKFEHIQLKREMNESEVYFPISDIGDAASLIQVLSKELTKRTDVNNSSVVAELVNIHISYNGLVDILSIRQLATILDTDSKTLKKKIDKIIDKNITLLETIQVEFMRQLLTNPKSVNEGILGRAIGGIAGFALGPKVGKIIAKVLGIEKGPLYNILTSRVVSAALAQELTKNLI